MKKVYQISLQALLFLVVFYGVFPIHIVLGLHSFFSGFGFFANDMIFLKLFLFYINYLILFPKLFERKKYWQWAIAAILLFFATIGLRFLNEEVIAYHLWGIHNYYWPVNWWYYVSDNTQWFLPWILLSSIIRLVQFVFKQEKQKREMEKQKSVAEIAFLRSQMNPHFLFNALNNIYSLTRQQSDYAPEAVMKLSEIMRYLLDENNKDKVPLEKEVRYIDNYIALQKLRYKEKENIIYKCEGVPDHQIIAPLMLIPFIENAFKHGSAKDPDNPILIQLDIQERQISLVTRNRKSKGEKDISTGIGLDNVKKRLELQYKNEYQLKIDDQKDFYQTYLQLTLS